MPEAAEIEELLRGASLRVTGPRLAVLAAVHDHPHADTKSLIGLAREHLGEVSQQAVYDVLRALTDAGLVRRIEMAGAVARYEPRDGEDHHHLVCRSCGAIADVDAPVDTTSSAAAAEHHGFVLDETTVVHRGLCLACATAHNS